MANVPIATLTENCWAHCPYFKVDIHDFLGDGMIAYRILECENLKRCKLAVTEVKKEEEECHNKSQEEK